MKKRTVIFLCLAFIGVGAAVFLVTSVLGKKAPPVKESPVGKATIEQPNILLIAVETLRADHVHTYGYSRDTTPQMDHFAENAFRFTNLVSTSSWTMPSHMSMLTGLYPGVHQTTDISLKLDDNIPTLAGVLKNNGYYTAGFVSNHLLESHFGFGKGFDCYDDFTMNLAARGETEELVRTSPPLNEAVLTWLRTNYNKRFFLFVHYFDPHYAYNPPPPYDTLFDPGYKGNVDGCHIETLKPNISRKNLNHVISLYDGEIRYTDEYIGALLKELETLGINEKTLIVLIGDHGEEFFEHGGTRHGETLYNEAIRVPLIIKLPGSHKPAVINTLASDVDLMPTICDYLKVSPPPGLQGKSLLPAMNGTAGEERSYVFSELTVAYTHVTKAIVSRDYKFICHLDTGTRELYDLAHDPGEKRNLVKTEQQKAAELERELMNFVVSCTRQVSALGSTGNNTVVHDEETKKKLKSLGYMQ